MGLFQWTGDVKPTSQRYGPVKLLGDFEQLMLLRLIMNNPGIYPHEMQQEGLLGLESMSVLQHFVRP